MRLGLLALCVLLLLLLLLMMMMMMMMNMDTLWVASIDLARHDALVVRLSEPWSLPLALDPSSAE